MPLDNDIRNYVNRTHANAWRRVKPGSTPDEPALVSSFLSSEMYRGLGSVVVGGLLVSTVFTLLLVPLLFSLVLDMWRGTQQESAALPAAAADPFAA